MPYLVEKSLAKSGGFGRIHHAFDRDTGEHVVVKVAEAADPALQKNAEDQLRHEYDILKRLETCPHAPHALKLSKDTGSSEEFGGHLYLAEEFVSGLSIQSIIVEGAVRPKRREVRKILVNGLEALSDIHYFGVLHGDVSPANIIVSSKLDVRFIDFGCAQFSERAKMMQYGTIYSDPVCIKRGNLAEEADVYSFAKSIAHLFYGQLVDADDITPFLPMDTWFKHALSLDRYTRFHTADEALIALQNGTSAARLYRAQRRFDDILKRVSVF